MSPVVRGHASWMEHSHGLSRVARLEGVLVATCTCGASLRAESMVDLRRALSAHAGQELPGPRQTRDGAARPRRGGS